MTDEQFHDDMRTLTGALSAAADAWNEKDSHELCIWHEMPTEEGWYWYDGEVWVPTYSDALEAPENRFKVLQTREIVRIECGTLGTSMWVGKECIETTDEDIIGGTWHGPIPCPWEEA